MERLWIAYFLVLFSFIDLASAQIPTVWRPYDVITYFCARWYHQAVVKNDVLYLYGGIETFNVPNLTVKSENNSLGYSKSSLDKM